MELKKIKFRSWDGASMMYSENHGLSAFFDKIKGDTVMQFTGVVCSKGKDIYEGDVLALSYGDHIIEGKRVFKAGYDVDTVRYVDGGFFLADYHDIPIGSFVDERDSQYDLLGNIYENPELDSLKVNGLGL
jgi:uncharacterized phage protein (TIGR01671 family)